MIRRASILFAAAFLLAVPAASRASLVPYSQNFETLNAADASALASDGWVVYGNVYSPDHSTYLYGYGTYPAPNGGTAFCAVAVGQGGDLQGTQQLSIYDDYNNTGAHSAGDQVESNVYHEQTIGAADVGTQWTFQFDGKLGNLVYPSTATAFIKTLDPTKNYVTTHQYTQNTTSIPLTWNTYSLSIVIDATMVGQLLQFGFNCTATNYQSSGVFYDNLTFLKTIAAGVDGTNGPGVFELRPATPNPFAGVTRLDWSLPKSGSADVSIYDIAGRNVARLFHGVAAAGPHASTWDGRLSDGRQAPAGIYRVVLQSAVGRMSRSIALTR